MANKRGSYNRISTPSKAAEKEEFEPFMVRQKEALNVRIRTAPRIGADFTGNYLGDGWHEVEAVQDGPGSESGWGRLASGTGWVALDFCEKKSK